MQASCGRCATQTLCPSGHDLRHGVRGGGAESSPAFSWAARPRTRSLSSKRLPQGSPSAQPAHSRAPLTSLCFRWWEGAGASVLTGRAQPAIAPAASVSAAHSHLGEGSTEICALGTGENRFFLARAVCPRPGVGGKGGKRYFTGNGAGGLAVRVCVSRRSPSSARTPPELFMSRRKGPERAHGPKQGPKRNETKVEVSESVHSTTFSERENNP